MSAITQEMSEPEISFPVVESDVLLAPGAAFVQLCQANPLRWGLLLAVSATAAAGAQPVNVTTLPGNAINTGVGLQTGSFLLLDFRAHPGLVTSAWFGSNPGGANVQLKVVEELAQQ